MSSTLLSKDKTVAQDCARQLLRIQEEHNDNITKMKTLMAELKSVWKGDSEVAYSECLTSMTSTFTKYGELLGDYSATLTRVTNDAFNNDSQHASEILSRFMK